MFLDEQFSDFSIVASGTTYAVHKIIVAQGSSFFTKLLSSDFSVTVPRFRRNLNPSL